MSIQIEDGKGSGKRAQVDREFRLRTFSTTVTDVEQITGLGNAYTFSSGPISVTANGTVFYFKNNEDANFEIHEIHYAVNNTGTHSDTPLFTLIKNPTGGDLISDATAAAVNSNNNFGSSNALEDSLVYKGKSGGTITGGTDIFYQIQPVNSQVIIKSQIYILQKGDSLAVKITPSLSSGTAVVYFSIIGHKEDD